MAIIQRKHGLLGKRPVNYENRKKMLRMVDIFDVDAILPKVPKLFGHSSKLPSNIGILGNDQVGNCVFAGGCHHVMYWNVAARKPIPLFTTADAIEDYSAFTGYVPGNPLTDQGTDMSTFPNYFKSPGLRDSEATRHTIVDATVSIQPGLWTHLMVAMYLFDGAGIGLNLPQSAEDQFDAGEPWTYVSDSPIIGGHYIAGFDDNSKGQGVAGTWGGLTAFDESFYSNYSDETNAYISLELLDAKGLSPELYDRAALEKYIAQV